MIRARFAYVLLVCLGLAQHPSAQDPQTALPAMQAEPAVVKVLSTGSGPKRPLRYKLVAGARDRIDMTMQMSISMDVPGVGPQSVDAPPLIMSLDFDVNEVLPNGDATLAMRVSSATMEGGGMPSGMLDPLKGLSAVMTMTDRGAVKAMKFDESPGNPAIQQLLAASGFDKLSAPMPDEPVGVGAKWEVMQAVTANGMRMDQKAVYEIVAMDQTSTTLAVVMEQSAGAQKLIPPGMPMEIDASLVEMKGGGSGRMTLADGSPALVGEMAIKSSVTMDMAMQGETQRMVTKTDVKLTTARGKR